MKEIISGFLDGIRPIEDNGIADWANKNRILTGKASAETGRFYWERFPFTKQIYDDMHPLSGIEKVVVSKGAQLGITECAINILGYYIDRSPISCAYVMPDESTATFTSKARIQPMIEDTPSLFKKVAGRGKEGGNTIFYKEFPGGGLTIMGAGSPQQLRSRPFGLVIGDELDGYPMDVKGEGNPIFLLETRTVTFGDRRKILYLSTPTRQGGSQIERELSATDIKKYYIPCLGCGAYQVLTFEQFRWENGNPTTVRYECEHCNRLIPEYEKTEMLKNGVWRPTKECKNPKISGYHISSLYSPLGQKSWIDIILEYEKATLDKSNASMKAFYNVVLGLSYEETTEAPDWQRLYERAEVYPQNTINEKVGFLTMGVDVQRDRIELEIVGWCRGRISYSIDYRSLLGDTTQPEVWNKLMAVMNETWTSTDGRILKIHYSCIDSGYNSSFVYDFLNRLSSRQAMAVKGSGTQQIPISTPKDIFVGRSGKRYPNVKLVTLGVNGLKKELYNLLRLGRTDDGIPDGYCYFPQYPDTYFKGLTAEAVRVKYDQNTRYSKEEWVKVYERNEPLDCRVYAMAAALLCNIHLMQDKHWNNLFSQQYNFKKVVEPEEAKQKASIVPKEPKKRKVIMPKGLRGK